MKLTKYWILLLLSGCAHYPKDLLNNQITKETYLNDNEHEIFEKATAEELAYICNNNFLIQHSCYFNYQALKQLTLSQSLLRYESQIEQLHEQQKCLFFENHFNLMKAQAYFDKKNYKKSKEISQKVWLSTEGFLARQAYMLLVESEQNQTLQNGTFSIKNSKKVINIDDLNEEDIFTAEFPFYKMKKKNKEQLEIVKSLKPIDIDSIIVLYQGIFPSEFAKGLLNSYENQDKIQSIKFFDLDKDLDFFNHHFKENNHVGVILYEVQNQSVIKLIQTVKEVGKTFIIDSSLPVLEKNSYFINNSYDDELKVIEATLKNFTDLAIIYDESHADLLKKSKIKNIKTTLVSAGDYEKKLDIFLRIPNRSNFFKTILSSDIKYLPKAQSLPPNVLLLLEPDVARLVYPYLLYWGQNKTVYFGLGDILSGDMQLDRTLDGVRIYKRRYLSSPHSNKKEMLGHDVFNIIYNFHLFEMNSEYIWNGNWGFYHLEGQYFARELNSKV